MRSQMWTLGNQWGILIIISLFTLGCGSGSSIQSVPVSGVVTMDGQPLVGAEVYFVCGDFTAFGRTSDDGAYMLAQGALPGMNRVFITKMSGSDPTVFVPGYGEEGLDEGQLQAAVAATGADPALMRRVQLTGGVPTSGVPRQFSDPADTRLSWIVPDIGTDAASFHLTSK